ncbi:MAG: methyltransferase family protein [bacterium]
MIRRWAKRLQYVQDSVTIPFMDNNIEERPNNFPLPPVVLIGFIIAGLVLGGVIEGFTSPGFGLVFRLIGVTLICAAIAMDVWVFSIFKKHETNIRPDRPAEALVDEGPFKFSRNPIYVGNVAIMIGMGLVTGIWLFFAFAVLTFLILDHFQIKREEAHLAAKFGPHWDEFSSKVRRWL